MAFSKLYTVLADSPAGFQTFNQAGANNDEMRTQMAIEHGTREAPRQRLGAPAPGTPDYSKLGRHDLQEVPRCVGATYLVVQPNLTFTASMGWTGQGVPYVWRWGTGFYFLPVIGLSQWWAIPVALAGASVTYLPPQMRPFYASATNGGNAGIWVSTYILDSGDFVPVDSAFSFSLYGKV